MVKPSVLKGTRDFLPEQIAKRDYLFDSIKKVYQKYGFLPIETPAMEKSETLLGKYGEEGDRLIFKVLNNGDFMSGVDSSLPSNSLAKEISKRALRYDLTVPFARFVSQHRNELSFPFKRYQIQPVWRADRPQKGRYQEFFQCDADVVGSDSLLHEVEFILIFDEVLTSLGFDQITIHLNNRKILTGIAEVSGCIDKFNDMAIALDKLDKIGLEKVSIEWSKRGISDVSIAMLSDFFNSKEIDLDQIEKKLKDSEIGLKGVEELRYVQSSVIDLGLSRADLEIDLTLARGLDYYTGAIFEVKTSDYAIGSICGGGRYDDLTGTFGLPDMSGIGVSFGADRIYDVLEATGKWPESLGVRTRALFVNFGDKEAEYCMRLLKHIRAKGISAELYPSSAKLKKQLKYADDRSIPYVCLIGDKEMESDVITLKEMSTGDQKNVVLSELIELLDTSER
ncbi:MAG: histidine--tRNA ligase [Flavobacteriales bacterium]|nr:histidine--tRNA ligase [Flavobacteriales bacterium]